MIFDLLTRKPAAQGRQIALLHVQAQQVKGGQDAPARFRDRRMFDEEGLPNQIRLGGFGEGPEFVVRNLLVAHGLSDEVMIHEQFVEAPEQEFLESRIIEVRMDVRDGSGHHDVFDLFGKGNPAGFGKNSFHRRVKNRRIAGTPLLENAAEGSGAYASFRNCPRARLIQTRSRRR